MIWFPARRINKNDSSFFIASKSKALSIFSFLLLSKYFFINNICRFCSSFIKFTAKLIEKERHNQQKLVSLFSVNNFLCSFISFIFDNVNVELYLSGNEIKNKSKGKNIQEKNEYFRLTAISYHH